MRAILLAAGRGSRLQQAVGAERPKCLLRFGGRTLLDRHLTILADARVGEIVLVVGFARQMIVDELVRLGRDDVELVVNERYTLGSVLTVHAAADALTRGGDVLVMDADVLYDRRMIDRLVANETADRLLVDGDFEPGDEPVKVCVKDGVPVEFRKRVAPGITWDRIGESVGFVRFREPTARRFAAIVARYAESGRGDQPHEEAIRDLLLDEVTPAGPRGVEGLDVADVTGLPWIEIDFPQDVQRANDDVLPRIESFEQSHRP